MKEELSLRERFDGKGYSIVGYARANELDKHILKYVLNETLTGERDTKNGKARKCILALKKSEVWIEPIPWDEKAA